MASEEQPPVVFDDDNPEWTEEDFARARPASEVLSAAAVATLVRKTDRPRGSLPSNTAQVTLRIDTDVLARFKATGTGWQSRINEALRKAAP